MLKVVRATSALLLVLAATAFAVLPARAQSSSRDYDFFAAAAQADGVTARFAINALLPIDEFVGLSSVTSESHFAVARSDALAALPDPGDLILTLPGTLSALAGVSGLPDYPAAAHADHPSVPEDEVVFVPDAGVGVGRLKTTADGNGSAATAALGDLKDTIGLLPAMSIGSIKTTATSRRVRPGVIEGVATSAVKDLRLGGELVHIASIESHVTTRVVDGKATVEEAAVEIAGATLAGFPVAITEDGIVAPGQAQALTPLIDALRTTLDAAGVTVAVTPATSDVAAGRATGTGGSLLIEAPLEVQGRPGIFSLEIGTTSASVEVRSHSPTVSGSSDAPLPGNFVTATPLPPFEFSLPLEGPDPLPPVETPSPTSTAADPPLALQAIASWGVRGLYGGIVAAAAAMVMATSLLGRRERNVPRSDLRPLWRW